MSCKSGIYTAMTTPTAVAVGGTIPLGTTVRRFGRNLQQVGDGIILSGTGYYDVGASITVAPTTAGTITATLYQDGVAVPGATASSAVTTAGNPVDLSIKALVLHCCECGSGTLRLVLTGSTAVTTGTVSNVALVVEKI